MKTKDETKENQDANREKEELKKNQKERGKSLDDKENSRYFGRHLKTNQTNNPYPLLQEKLSKNPPEKRNKPASIIFKSSTINNLEEVKVSKEKKSEESVTLTLSQINQEKGGIIPGESKEVKEYREYKDLALAGENKDTLNVKVGNFFVKKTTSNSQLFVPLLQNKKVQSYLPVNEADSLYRCDYEVKDNPQYVAEYVKDIYKHLRETERINQPDFELLEKVQNDVNANMRAVLVDWIIEVHQKFKLNPETLYLTINLVDRYLNIKRINRSKLQLVAVSAMLIASKYEEIYAPEARDFVYVTDRSYTREEILQMEYQILSGLNFDILQVSPYNFLKRFHFCSNDSLKTFYFAQFILEFSLLEFRMLLHTPSVKAAACLFLARKILKIEPAWPYELVTMSTYAEKDLKVCAKDVAKVLELMPKITLKACILKFSSVKFMEVAKTKMFY